ncbi:C-type lectin domain family 10 member A-like [Lithobates pipiens]
MDDLEIRSMKNTENVKEIPAARSTKYRVILILGVLLIVAFLVVVILTGLLFTYYKSIKEEMTHLKNEGSTDRTCSEEWIHYELSCYYMSSNRQSWNVSRKECQNNMADLMVINSEEEMMFLRDNAFGKYLWIGLTDVDGTWQWVDGTPYDPNTTFWKANQPDNWAGHGHGGGEDCVATGYDWNDDHCLSKLLYVCEKKISC